MSYCLSVVLQLDKSRDYHEHSHVGFCPSKQRSIEPVTCFDLGLERYQWNSSV